MLYDSTKVLLQSIVLSLEAGESSELEDRLERGKNCLYEMHQMCRSSYRAYRSDAPNAKYPAQLPITERLNRAMPHVKAMVSAMRRGDEATAIERGRAALAAM